MKLILATIAVLAAVIGTTAVVSATPSYCGSGTWATTYRAKFNYPTGTYWQKQIAAYPDYYAANNAYYVSNYSCN